MADSRPIVGEPPTERAQAFLRLADHHLDAGFRGEVERRPCVRPGPRRGHSAKNLAGVAGFAARQGLVARRAQSECATARRSPRDPAAAGWFAVARQLPRTVFNSLAQCCLSGLRAVKNCMRTNTRQRRPVTGPRAVVAAPSGMACLAARGSVAHGAVAKSRTAWRLRSAAAPCARIAGVRRRADRSLHPVPHTSGSDVAGASGLRRTRPAGGTARPRPPSSRRRRRR